MSGRSTRRSAASAGYDDRPSTTTAAAQHQTMQASSSVSSGRTSPSALDRNSGSGQSAKRQRTTATTKAPIRVLPRYDTPGDVFVVGTGDCGQLGLGEDVVEKPRPAILRFFDDLEIIDVVAGGMHNLVLSRSGQVYSWGCNDDGALGRKTRKHTEDEMVPGAVEGLEEIKVVRIAAGDSVSVALSESGNVYAWGTFRSTNGILGLDETLIKTSTLQPKQIAPRVLQDIIDIAAGTNHVIALSASGKIYTWGSGEQYQLGRRCSPRDHTLSLRPTNVTFLTRAADQRYLHEVATQSSTESTPMPTPRGSPTKAPHRGTTPSSSSASSVVTATTTTATTTNEAVSTGPFLGVFAGGYHSFVLSRSYQLWACGLNNYGQTGAGSNEQVQEVFRIGTLSYPITASTSSFSAATAADHVVHVCAGEQHSLATTAAGRVFVFGRSDSNQLGLPPMASRPVSANKVDSLTEAFAETSIGAYKSVPIEHPTLKNIQKCGAAGQWSAAIDREGQLYTWGYGDNGQLATGECHDEETPVHIALKSRKVLALGCGGQHMVLLLTKKEE